jgi:hypothetical protein
MSEKIKFQAIINASDRGGAYVTIPFNVEEVFGKKRVKIKATIDGVPYQGSLVRIGGPGHILGILKKIRSKINKNIGDSITIIIEEDTEPRIVLVPDDLQQAFSTNPDAKAFFLQLAYSHKRKFVQWVEEAKRIETRQSRIQKTVVMLRAKKTR